MSVVAGNSKGYIMITKGAPEEILKLCNYYVAGSKKAKLNKKVAAKALQVYHDLSNDGYRVLAVAEKKVSKKPNYSKDDESDMNFAGFVSFLDPPKRDIKSVIKELEGLGIEVKVITGDNELVTKKICDEVGLRVNGVMLGEQISRLTDSALRVKAQSTTLFAKCSPTDKSRVISALRSGGDVVGYLGDGINDAPSLKAADVGISVNNAVDVAKESADLVLTKKSLHDLKEGIIEGRKTFGNTMKYIMMALSSNFGTMFSATGAVLFLPYLPMLPIQILLNNLIYDVSQTAIPTDNVDEEWTQKPKRWNMDFVKKFMYVFGPLSSVFDFITFFILFLVIRASAPVFQTGWFIESLATQTLVIHIIRTKDTPFIKSTSSRLLVLSSVICLALGVILPYTSLGKVFGFEPLPGNILFILAIIVLAYLSAVEIVKKWFYTKFNL
ncbi:putative copper-exporting P-type ATPase A [uncultured archaeon]|nr:putative copper-exporting P-type ATPase A [uncultured archaeon]